MAKESHDDPIAEAVEALRTYGSQRAAAKALGIARSTMQERLAKAERGVLTEVGELERLRLQNRYLQEQNKALRTAALTDEAVKQNIFRLVNTPASPPPRWLTASPKKRGRVVGVPTLLVSDIHFGERVSAAQINGLNEYTMEIARRRLQTMVDVTISLLRNEFSRIEYPGMVLALAGDMVSGSIHPELVAINEARDAKVLRDLQEILHACISRLAGEFGRLFIPCVTGNHGRLTQKTWAKDRNFTNADWILYQWLRSRFADDKRVTFYVADGADAYYRVFNHRYLLCHGDAFKGGDGIIGALGPLARGDAKKRARNSEVGLDYETMICGHWHRLLMLRRMICNGSVKGVDEWSYQMGFPYEEPLQALWITDSRRGITFQMAVQVERATKRQAVSEWVSVKP